VWVDGIELSPDMADRMREKPGGDVSVYRPRPDRDR
jgi:hypothetical protein